MPLFDKGFFNVTVEKSFSNFTQYGGADPRFINAQGNPVAQHLLGLIYDKGMGVPTDHVAAHIWLNLAAARTKGNEHEDNVRLRDAVASKMSLGQLSDAQYLARAWVPKPER